MDLWVLVLGGEGWRASRLLALAAGWSVRVVWVSRSVSSSPSGSGSLRRAGGGGGGAPGGPARPALPGGSGGLPSQGRPFSGMYTYSGDGSVAVSTLGRGSSRGGGASSRGRVCSSICFFLVWPALDLRAENRKLANRDRKPPMRDRGGLGGRAGFSMVGGCGGAGAGAVGGAGAVRGGEGSRSVVGGGGCGDDVRSMPLSTRTDSARSAASATSSDPL